MAVIVDLDVDDQNAITVERVFMPICELCIELCKLDYYGAVVPYLCVESII